MFNLCHEPSSVPIAALDYASEDSTPASVWRLYEYVCVCVCVYVCGLGITHAAGL